MKKTSELKEALKKGDYKDLLSDIYVDESKIKYQTERYIKAIEKFEKLYGEGEAAIYSAPGRSEVGGSIQITSMVKFLRRLSILTLLQLQEKLMTI